RFGLNPELREPARDNGSYVLALADPVELRRFEHEVGAFGCESEIALLVRSVSTVPAKVLVGASENPRRMQSVDVFAPTLWESAAAFLAEGNAEEHLPAEADIRWDEIVSIDYDGNEQVYDLTVPFQHNFVAGDIIVHNTSFALNLVSHAALTG